MKQSRKRMLSPFSQIITRKRSVAIKTKSKNSPKQSMIKAAAFDTPPSGMKNL